MSLENIGNLGYKAHSGLGYYSNYICGRKCKTISVSTTGQKKLRFLTTGQKPVQILNIRIGLDKQALHQRYIIISLVALEAGLMLHSSSLR